jgi:UDP-2,4-diacetamido-2,4,6-trideoxy-beta-L-altropyranose hydrolase
MLYIRADGNAKIGTGHIMRCLSIADAVKKRGGEASFIVADLYMEKQLTESGFQVICLNSVWNQMDGEIDKLTSVIEAKSIKKLLVDSYYVTEEYLNRLRELTYLIYIDDLNAFNYPCDMLINYNCYADKFDYLSRYRDTELLLGCRYVPLREEFYNLPQRIPEREVRAVMITAGGSDLYNVAGKIVKLAKSTSDFKLTEFHVVAGQLNPHVVELSRLSSKNNGVIIYKNVQDMSKLMRNCDVAVSAGGSTLYELCACGVPTVTLTTADNQLDNVNSFGNGYMINAGVIQEDEELCLNRILEGIRRYASDYRLRCEYSEKMKRLVDGSGALRIAQAVVR